MRPSRVPIGATCCQNQPSRDSSCLEVIGLWGFGSFGRVAVLGGILIYDIFYDSMSDENCGDFVLWTHSIISFVYS